MTKWNYCDDADDVNEDALIDNPSPNGRVNKISPNGRVEDKGDEEEKPKNTNDAQRSKE